MATPEGKAKSMANLRPYKKGQLSPEKAKALGSAGGKKSADAKKARKSFKQLAQSMLNEDAPESIKSKIKEMFPNLSEDEITSKMAILYTQYGKALQGDTRAFEVLRDTAGEKPVEKQEITGLDGAPLETVSVNIDAKDLAEKGKSIVDIMSQIRGRKDARTD